MKNSDRKKITRRNRSRKNPAWSSRIRISDTALIPSSLCYTSRPSSIHTKPVNQGHPATVFCEISVRRSKNCLEFSIAWGRLKISRWPFHSRTIFEAYLINAYDFLKFDFSHFTPQISLFFVEKGHLKVSQSKMRCREESEKLSLS